jgi:hypothetical protein
LFFQDIYDEKAAPVEIEVGSVLPVKFTPESCFEKPVSTETLNLTKCFNLPTRQFGLAMLTMPRGVQKNKDGSYILKITCLRGRRHWFKGKANFSGEVEHECSQGDIIDQSVVEIQNSSENTSSENTKSTSTPCKDEVHKENQKNKNQHTVNTESKKKERNASTLRATDDQDLCTFMVVLKYGQEEVEEERVYLSERQSTKGKSLKSEKRKIIKTVNKESEWRFRVVQFNSMHFDHPKPRGPQDLPKLFTDKEIADLGRELAWSLTTAGNEHDKLNLQENEGFAMPHRYHYRRRKFIESQSNPSLKVTDHAFEDSESGSGKSSAQLLLEWLRANNIRYICQFVKIKDKKMYLWTEQKYGNSSATSSELSAVTAQQIQNSLKVHVNNKNRSNNQHLSSLYTTVIAFVFTKFSILFLIINH